jgi:hypothetical protein
MKKIIIRTLAVLGLLCLMAGQVLLNMYVLKPEVSTMLVIPMGIIYGLYVKYVVFKVFGWMR